MIKFIKNPYVQLMLLVVGSIIMLYEIILPFLTETDTLYNLLGVLAIIVVFYVYIKLGMKILSKIFKQ